MKKMYERSINMIKTLDKVPTQIEWNKLARLNNLLSYASMQYIENSSFKDIYNKYKRTD